jgi:hypothetical protein
VDSVAAVDLAEVAEPTVVLAPGMEAAIGNGTTRTRGLNLQHMGRVALVLRIAFAVNPKAGGMQSMPKLAGP